MGNTLFLGFLGASAYFGYYTYRYSTQEIETLIEETKTPEKQFPGSDVRPCSSSLIIHFWAQLGKIKHLVSNDSGAFNM